MSLSKPAWIRYRTLDNCFGSNRNYSMSELIEKCNEALSEYGRKIEKRQVYRDISFMKSEDGFSAPITTIRDSHEVYYLYSDKSFSIVNQPITSTEAQQLRETLSTLQRFKELPQYAWMDEILTRLDASFELSNSPGNVIEFEKNEFLKGTDHISVLYQAIINKQVLNLTYKPFNKEQPFKKIFHPHYLKQYNNRWFVFGLCKESLEANHADQVSNFPLDRIVSIGIHKTKKYIESDIDYSTYFEDIIGVTLLPGFDPFIVKLRVKNERYPYLETKPLHGSQKVINAERTDTHTVITLEVKFNRELESTILYYGDDVEVLAPEFLRNKIRYKVENLYLKYCDKK